MEFRYSCHFSMISSLNIIREYMSKTLVTCKGDLKQSLKTINLLLNKKSKTTKIDPLKVKRKKKKNEEETFNDHDIANSMNNYFYLGRNPNDNIFAQPYPLLSHQYD